MVVLKNLCFQFNHGRRRSQIARNYFSYWFDGQKFNYICTRREEKTKLYSHLKNISWNQLALGFNCKVVKQVDFTEFLCKNGVGINFINIHTVSVLLIKLFRESKVFLTIPSAKIVLIIYFSCTFIRLLSRSREY